MAMTPEEQMNFNAQFQEMRKNLSNVMRNDKSENSRALWGIVWMLSVINQDLGGIYQELDYKNRAERMQSDMVNKQIEEFQKKMQESQKDAPKNFEEFQKSFEEAFQKAQDEAKAQFTPEKKAEIVKNLRDMADEIEKSKDEDAEDVAKRAKEAGLHVMDKEEEGTETATVEGEETEDGEVETYTVEFQNDDQK